MGWICPRCLHSPIEPRNHQYSCPGPAAAPLVAAQPAQDLSVVVSQGSTLNRSVILDPGSGAVAGWADGICLKYEAAFEHWRKAPDEDRRSQFSYLQRYCTDVDLGRLSYDQHLQNIDEIWQESFTYKSYNCEVAWMDDPSPGNMESSLSGTRPQAFVRSGICFRCDSRVPEAVKATGFKSFYSLGSAPDWTRGTVLERMATAATPQPAVSIGGVDIVSETAVCVSRNLRGCGKFPKPEHKGPHFIYAFKLPAVKRGFDTENYQFTVGKGQSKRWLPGEKAFAELLPSEILAWVPVMKLGSENDSDSWGWYKYDVMDFHWKFLSDPDPEDKAYLEAEMMALCKEKSVITVTEAEDFVAG